MENPLSPFLGKTTQTYDGKFILASIQGEFYVKVWTKRFPEGKIFRCLMSLPDVGFVLEDDNHRKYVYSTLLKREKFKRGFFSFACSEYCGLRRIHLSCFWCRKRKIFKGEKSNPVRIKLYFAPHYLDTKFCQARKILIWKMRSLTEWLSGV